MPLRSPGAHQHCINVRVPEPDQITEESSPAAKGEAGKGSCSLPGRDPG